MRRSNDLLFDYVGFLWTSPTGADVTVHREDEARTIAMRVGEENTWYDMF